MKSIRILRLALLALATAAVAGCVTSPGYGYRAGQGDYYYGQPSAEYRYRGGYGPYHHGYGYPYGYPHGYGRSGWSFGISYGHPYYRYGYGGRYAYPWYGWPYYGYPYYRPPVVVRPRPDGNSDVPPWRDLDRMRELERNRRGARIIDNEPMRPDVVHHAPPRPTVGTEPRSRIGQNIQRAREAPRMGREEED